MEYRAHGGNGLCAYMRKNVSYISNPGSRREKRLVWLDWRETCFFSVFPLNSINFACHVLMRGFVNCIFLREMRGEVVSERERVDLTIESNIIGGVLVRAEPA